MSEPLTLTDVYQAVAASFTPWLALGEGDAAGGRRGEARGSSVLPGLHAASVLLHNQHFGDPKRRPNPPWAFEEAQTDQGPGGIPLRYGALIYGVSAGELRVSLIRFEHGLRCFGIEVHTGYSQRHEKSLVIALWYELDKGMMGVSDPVGDTFFLDHRLFPQALHIIAPLARLFELEPRLEGLLAHSKGGDHVRELVSSYHAATAATKEPG